MIAEEMAALHARAFAGSGRGWSVDEFAALLKDPNILFYSNETAFALGRFAADEAELLTVATDPNHRRQGLAKAVLSNLENGCVQKGVDRLFLEVAEDNIAALSLYRSMGYIQIARRSNYYARSSGHVDAIICEKRLGS